MGSYDLIMIAGMGAISIESPLAFAILLQNASILRRNAKLFIMVERTTIKFEDMPKALAYLIEKVEELDRKLESLSDSSSSGKDMWMGLRSCARISRRARQHRLSMDGRAHI